MWMDYGSPPKNMTIDSYAEAVARYAERALKQVRYHDFVPLAMVEKRLELDYRVPDEKRFSWAKPIAACIENDLAKNQREVYAKEALILHERQRTEIKLQAIRIGELTIATLPNEVYALTGLKLKAQSPFASHFNVELANGAEGYIPTPEQHVLGGYTTWPAHGGPGGASRAEDRGDAVGCTRRSDRPEAAHHARRSRTVCQGGIGREAHSLLATQRRGWNDGRECRDRRCRGPDQ